MGFPKQFNTLLVKQFKFHAAWPPFVNIIEVGDYGLISDGIFTRMGNIKRDFGISFITKAGHSADMIYTSEGVTLTRLVGNAEVSAFPDQDQEARLKVSFTREKLFYIRASLTTIEMDGQQDVALKLIYHPQWDRRFKIVSATYRSKNGLILSSAAPACEIELAGSASRLSMTEQASGAIDVRVATAKSVGLQLIGKSGVVGIKMFYINWMARTKVMTTSDMRLTASVDADWPIEAPDDL